MQHSFHIRRAQIYRPAPNNSFTFPVVMAVKGLYGCGLVAPRGEAGTATTSLLQWARTREARRRTMIHSLSGFIEACCCSAAAHRKVLTTGACMYVYTYMYTQSLASYHTGDLSPLLVLINGLTGCSMHCGWLHHHFISCHDTMHA